MTYSKKYLLFLIEHFHGLIAYIVVFLEHSAVIGVKDPYKMQRVRAYVVLNKGVDASDATKQSILNHCKEYLDVFERPKEIIFRDELPKTLVGKVAYRYLEEEAEKEEAEAVKA